MPVVERQDKVEKVGLAEVRGRLFLKMSPGESDPTEDAQKKKHSASSSKTSHSDNKTYLTCFFYKDFSVIKSQLYIEGKMKNMKPKIFEEQLCLICRHLNMCYQEIYINCIELHLFVSAFCNTVIST